MWLVLFTNIGRTCNLQKYAVAVLSGAHADLRVCFGAEHACSCTVIKHFDSAKFRIIEEPKKVHCANPARSMSKRFGHTGSQVHLPLAFVGSHCLQHVCRNRSMQEQINARTDQCKSFTARTISTARTMVGRNCDFARGYSVLQGGYSVTFVGG